MKTIYKYALKRTGTQVVQLPLGARILCVQNQIDNPCLWALINKGYNDTEAVQITMAGTGHDIDSPGDYVGTFQLLDEALVFHVFAKALK